MTNELAETEFRLKIDTKQYLTNLSVIGETINDHYTDESPPTPTTPATTLDAQSETAQRDIIYGKLDKLAEATGEEVPEENDVPKHWLRYPLLFMYVNCVVIVSSLALCFSPTSTNIANAYGVHQ